MAEEKTFSVGVQTSSPKRISVTSNVSENPITASADTGLYYSQLAKNWAIGEGLIQNEDYSSKTWAGESKSSADLSKMYSEAASLDLTNLENKIIEYDEQINTTITEGLENINTSVTSGVGTIETLQANSIAEITTNKESALNDITTAETNVLANIDTSKLNTLAQIEELANSSIEDINATGIDSKVSKSGDTMTGILNFKRSDTVDFTNTNNTVYSEAGTIYFRDKNDKVCGQVRNSFNDYNNLATTIEARRSVNGAIKTSQIQIYVDKDGNAIATAPNPPQADSSNKIATTSFCDGVTSSKSTTLASSITLEKDTLKEFSLSSYLPNDGNKYEVLFTCFSTPAGDGTAMYISTDANTNSVCLYRGGNNFNGGNARLIVGTGRKVQIKDTSGKQNLLYLIAQGYRKVR